MKPIKPPPSMRPESHPSFPTILVVGNWNEPYNALVRSLEQAGYLVLVARSGAEALGIAKTHSRPIHLLLAADTVTSPALLTELPLYQPGIRVLVITAFTETLLARVKVLLEPAGKKDERTLTARATGS
jgi:CheY-like chemotaxis protein